MHAVHATADTLAALETQLALSAEAQLQAGSQRLPLELLSALAAAESGGGPTPLTEAAAAPLEQEDGLLGARSRHVLSLEECGRIAFGGSPSAAPRRPTPDQEQACFPFTPRAPTDPAPQPQPFFPHTPTPKPHPNHAPPPRHQAISSLLRGRDVLANLTTGGGKSAIFLLPALLHGTLAAEWLRVRAAPSGGGAPVLWRGGALVVGPLRALIRTQVDLLNARAAALGVGAVAGLATDPLALRQWARGDLRLLFTSPEQGVRRRPLLAWAARRRAASHRQPLHRPSRSAPPQHRAALLLGSHQQPKPTLTLTLTLTPPPNLPRQQLGLVVIDEAHLVEEAPIGWSDFRPDYRDLQPRACNKAAAPL